MKDCRECSFGADLLGWLDDLHRENHKLVTENAVLKDRLSRKRKRQPEKIWSEFIICNACGERKPGYGAELWSGDICRCSDCRKVGKPLQYHERGGGLIGIIGVSPGLEQYHSQLEGGRC